MWCPEDRNRTVTIKYLCEWIMLLSDGVPSSHPTFTLVLQSNQMRTHIQGRVEFSYLHRKLIHTWPREKNSTGMVMRMERTNCSPGCNTLLQMFQELTHTGNLYLGSYALPPYIINTCRASIFHTSSVFNFHDPRLINIMANYVAALDGKVRNVQQ